VLALQFQRYPRAIGTLSLRGGSKGENDDRDDDRGRLSSQAVAPVAGGPQNREGRQHRRRDDDAERVAGVFLAGRDAGELRHDEFEIAFHQSEVGSRLIGPSQREDVFVWHDARYGRTWLPGR
jgi:hypothetical protein